MQQASFIIGVKPDLFRLGLKQIILEQFPTAIIRFASTKRELKSALFDNYQSIALVDFDSLDMASINDYREISVSFPKVNWLFIGDVAEASFVLSLASTFDKAGFVLKSCNSDVFTLAIQSAILGNIYFCNQAMQVVLSGHNRKIIKSGKDALLTTTELQLLQLFAQGKTAKEIADIRCLSHHTVNTHRKNIFRKLEVSNIQELIKYGLKNGLVDLIEYYI